MPGAIQALSLNQVIQKRTAMKKSSLILMIIFLFTTGLFQATAQNKTMSDKDKKIQESIEAQKRAMTEQEAATKDLEKTMQEQKIELEKALQNVPMGIEEKDKLDNAIRSLQNSRGMRSYFSNGEPFIYTPGVEFYGHGFGDDIERTTWEFTKSIKEASFSRDYTIDVESTVNTIAMAVNGDCKSGEIRIKIIMPGGKIYSDIVIDEFGNLNWRKSFTISDTENKDKAGAWKFEISTVKASGYFKISLQTY